MSVDLLNLRRTIFTLQFVVHIVLKMSQEAGNKEPVSTDDDWEEESEHDPFSTDSGSVYLPSNDSGSEYSPSDEEPKRKKVTKNKKANNGTKTTTKPKSARKRKNNSDSNGAEKSKRDIANEKKIKLASLVQEEEIIYNLQHKMHSNNAALSAAWKRVATKMEESGKYFRFFRSMIFILVV